MNQTPWGVYHELRRMLTAYLDTTYKLSHPMVAAERLALFESDGVISQVPFVETTPRFAPGKWLREINPLLADLVKTGLLTEKFELYKHQQRALESMRSTDNEIGNLIVATGTGSGKTESFLLPILDQILQEATNWARPHGKPESGSYDKSKAQWLHSRRHESRSPAIRALILYPMNALVNDQLKRLRKVLARRESIAWQHNHLNGNRIYFGRYTSQTAVPGSPHNQKRQKDWEIYQVELDREADLLTEKQLESGGWALPGRAEMLCRWDMQSAPPDILITNYSMLEYLMVRPLEANIFETTKSWLQEDPRNVFTLVLDEAHMYTGARGTEVALLIRRLYERLGIGPERVRCIATSASLGDGVEAEFKAKQFAAGLFNQRPEAFTLVMSETIEPKRPESIPSLSVVEAFSRFNDEFSPLEPDEATKMLLGNLGKEITDEALKVQLYKALEDYPQIHHLRGLTARQAVALDDLSAQLWGAGAESAETIKRATAGILAAGTWARREVDSDAPPLLPTRLHLMFRGLPGLWACMNPSCSEVPREYRSNDRPCGKLYVEPTPWCKCGSRVLELFACHVCGLLHMGGIEDHNHNILWPYEPNLDGRPEQYSDYTVFVAESPVQGNSGAKGIGEQFRSMATSAPTVAADEHSRLTWVYTGKDYPTKCHRCGSVKRGSRQIVEKFKTRGHQSFAVLMEEAFRLQPARHKVQPELKPIDTEITVDDLFAEFAAPVDSVTDGLHVRTSTHDVNAGRKVLAFSDGRQDAALLAGDLEYQHFQDSFRQLLLLALRRSDEATLPIPILVDKLYDLCLERKIDPTGGEISGFWQVLNDLSDSAIVEKARTYLRAYLRNEMSDRHLGVEALGLARWGLHLPASLTPEKMPPLAPLASIDTYYLWETAVRILLQEDVILPPGGSHKNWPLGIVRSWEQKVIVLGKATKDHESAWPPHKLSRLHRFLTAVAKRIEQGETWVDKALDFLFKALTSPTVKILIPAVGTSGHGIPIERLALKSMPSRVHRCKSCGFLSADTVRGVCIRCYNDCEVISLADTGSRPNYYRILAQTVLDNGHDPFPLSVQEHTAAISTDQAAKRERYFQDEFLSGENPDDSRVDMLSVTTTMEMGIDIGDLTAVGLRNMPPSVANYQQRAGRAGRRSDGIATVVTYSQHRSHDQYYFDHVSDIVKGKVRIPTLYLDNEVIAQRHVNAIVLQRFFLEYGPQGQQGLLGAWGTARAFKDGNLGVVLEAWLSNNTTWTDLERSCGAVVPVPMHSRITAWLEMVPTLVLRALANVAPSAEILGVLIEANILPRYAFPIDVVALWTSPPSGYSRGDEVQRDLQIGLSEFAPGAEVIVDKKIHKCVALYVPFDDKAHYHPDGWYYECPSCRSVQVWERSDDGTLVKPNIGKCSVCGDQVKSGGKYRLTAFIRPKGFATDWTQAPEKYRGGGREKVGYTTPSQLEPGQGVDADHKSYFQDRLWVANRNGNLSMVNYGKYDSNDPTGPGFYVCAECGRALSKPEEDHTKPTVMIDGVAREIKCKGKAPQKSILLHKFQSNLTLLGMPLHADYDADVRHPVGRAAWYSLGTALLRTAAVYLQIQPEELAVNVRAWPQSDERLLAEVYLYDTLPGGAGYAKDISENIDEIVRRTANNIRCTNPRCGGACYSCLMDYNNQPLHALLDRRLASTLLGYLQTGHIEGLSRDEQLRALDPLEALLRDMPTYKMQRDTVVNGVWAPGLVQVGNGNATILHPIHDLWSLHHPDVVKVQREAASKGQLISFVRPFDLRRQPINTLREIK